MDAQSFEQKFIDAERAGFVPYLRRLTNWWRNTPLYQNVARFRRKLRTEAEKDRR